MGKFERKIGQTVRREAIIAAREMRLRVAKHRPWWVPSFFWNRIVGMILDASIESQKNLSLKGEGKN